MRHPPLALLAVGVVCLALVILYWSVGAKLLGDWSADENYSHGFLIIPIALYLAWERRPALVRAPIRPSAAGLLIILASVAVLAAGTLGAELFLQRVSLLGVLAGIVVFLLGWAHLRVLAFPLLFLLLMIPIPAILFNQVAFPLQLLASRFGEATLLALGIPVLREGNVITLANVTLEVAEACSGIRSLVSLLTLSIVYGYFTEPRPWARAALALASVPVAILANALRVAGTGVASHYWGPAAAEGFMHTFSGWLVFVVAFVMLFGVQKVIARVGESPRPAASSAARERPPAPAHWRALPRALAVALCLVLGAVGIAHASRTEDVPPRESFDRFPAEIGAWRGQSADRFDQRTLTVLGVDEYVNRVYLAPQVPPVGLYIGFYRTQRQGETMHSPLNCLPGAGWEPLVTERVTIPVPAGGGTINSAILVNRVVIQKGLERQVVFYWYQSHGRVTASEYWGKIYTVLDAVRLNRTDAAMIRVMSPVADPQAPTSQAASERAAIDFVTAVFPLLDRFLPE